MSNLKHPTENLCFKVVTWILAAPLFVATWVGVGLIIYYAITGWPSSDDPYDVCDTPDATEQMCGFGGIEDSGP